MLSQKFVSLIVKDSLSMSKARLTQYENQTDFLRQPHL